MKIISEYCEKKNLNLTIAFNSLRKDKKKKTNYFNKEKNFYDSIIKNFSIGNEESIFLSNKSKLVICHNSNLGYELIFAKCKTEFIDTITTHYKYFKGKKAPP